METGRPTNWTIEELGAEVALALSVGYEGAPNDRVRDIPDRRTIRYYTTLGLVDRPAEMRGRTALYGPRHLMQLAAIKRLQARGLSLAEVQRQLLGLTDAALAGLARLPASPVSATVAGGSERVEAFWKAAPASAGDGPHPDRGEEAAASAAARTLQGIRLDDDATLLIDSPRPIDAEDLEAIRQ